MRSFSGMILKQTMADCVNALKEWTRKARATVIFDSTVDEFTADGLFEKVKVKPNIAVVATTTDGDVFGGFYSVTVTKQDWNFNDPTIFAFSFESRGRCSTPRRFAVGAKVNESAFVFYWKDDRNGFVQFGVFGNGCFLLGNERSYSYCSNMSQGFEGIEDTTLTGKSGTLNFGPYQHCARLVAVQLSN